MLLPVYCWYKSSSALLLNGGTNTVIKVEDLFNRDSNREHSICSVAGFFKSEEKIPIIGLLIYFQTESATVILQKDPPLSVYIDPMLQLSNLEKN